MYQHDIVVVCMSCAQIVTQVMRAQITLRWIWAHIRAHNVRWERVTQFLRRIRPRNLPKEEETPKRPRNFFRGLSLMRSGRWRSKSKDKTPQVQPDILQPNPKGREPDIPHPRPNEEIRSLSVATHNSTNSMEITFAVQPACEVLLRNELDLT